MHSGVAYVSLRVNYCILACRKPRKLFMRLWLVLSLGMIQLIIFEVATLLPYYRNLTNHFINKSKNPTHRKLTPILK